MHIPAVAPLMAGRARSQTLSDIGSAFSTPLTAAGGAASPLPPTTAAGADPTSPTATLRPRTASRLLRWFSRANPGDESPVVPAQPPPFYQCATDGSDASSDSSSTLSSSRLSSSTEAGFPQSEDERATAATTPHSASPTREASLESRSAAVAAKAVAAAHHYHQQRQRQGSPRRPSTSSSLRRPSVAGHPLAQHPQQQGAAHVYRPKQRGLSIDTTLSSASTVATSILGPTEPMPVRAAAAGAAKAVPPLHSGPVGVAY
jgi:hypothetical protein